MAKHHVTTTVNGDIVEYLCESEQTLLDCLRDELELTGVKEGCSSGDCGACSVLLDGRFRWDYFAWGAALDVVYVALGVLVFRAAIRHAREHGTLMQMGE